MKLSILKTFCLGLALTLISTISIAGTVINSQVAINDAAKSASGSMSAVRNSSDNTQMIFCQTLAFGGPAAQLNCTARNSVGTVRRCVTNNAGLISEFKSIDSNSYIHFRWDDAGQCTLLQIGNGSPFGQ